MSLSQSLVCLSLATISTIALSQNTGEAQLSGQATICVNASYTLELMINGKNSGSIDRLSAIRKINESNLPPVQKNNLTGLVSLIFKAQDLNSATEKLNSKQIAISYYQSCMSAR